MTKTIFFHVGSIKTGSTGLQKFCYENRQALLNRDLDYIQFQPPQLNLPRWTNADFLLNPEFDPEVVAQFINASPASRILISEEGLLARPHVWQHPVFQGMRRVVILYLRNAVDLVASWASENSLPYNFLLSDLLGGRIVSVDEGIGHWSMEYRAMLFQFMDAVQNDANLEIFIRPFPPESQDLSLLEDFLRTLELDDQVARDLTSKTSGGMINEGRSRKYCDAAYYLSEFAAEYRIRHCYSLPMVDTVYNRLRSGDDRKVIATLSRAEMQFIRNRLLAAGQALVSNLGAPEKILEMPTAFDAHHAPYSRIDLTELRQLFLEYVVNEQTTTSNIALTCSNNDI